MGTEKDKLIDDEERERMYSEKCSVCGNPVDPMYADEKLCSGCAKSLGK
jgi:hypothetical protein